MNLRMNWNGFNVHQSRYSVFQKHGSRAYHSRASWRLHRNVARFVAVGYFGLHTWVLHAYRWNNSTRAEQYCQSVYVWIVLLMEYVDSSFGQSESQRINSNMGKALPPVWIFGWIETALTYISHVIPFFRNMDQEHITQGHRDACIGT